MKIELYYKELNIGTLSKDKEDYIFLVNEKDYKTFGEKYVLGKIYEFKNSKSTILVQPFDRIVFDIKKRADILFEIKKDADSNDFEILYEYGKLPQRKTSFFIKSL